MYTFTDDYKTQFKAHIDGLYADEINGRITELIKTKKQAEKDGERSEEYASSIRSLIEYKSAMVSELTEAYIKHTEERPDSLQLDRLSTWIQKGAEHIADDGVLSERQLRRIAQEREFSYTNVPSVKGTMKEDGNRVIPRRHTVDDEYENHFEWVRIPYDDTDKRENNRVMTTYYVKDSK